MIDKRKEEFKKYVLDKSQSGAYDLAGSIEEETEDLYNFINQNYVPKVEFKQVSNPLDPYDKP